MNVRPEPRQRKRPAARGALVLLFGLLLAAVGGLLIVQPAAATSGNQPPGANGSVKIDEIPVDSTKPPPGNEPHIDDCHFAVQFFGFDEGQNSVVVTFRGWPPSGDKSVVNALEGRSEFTFEGGTPPGNTLNHTEPYVLDTSGLTVNHKGEVHIKLHVIVTDAGGKVDFKKFKVFWVKQCGPTAPPTPAPSETPTPTETPSPTPTETSTESPSPSPTTPDETVAPTAPGPTEFEGGLGLEPSNGQGGTGRGPTSALGWFTLLAGLGIAGLGTVRLLRPANGSSRGA
jgi:hypothetical protein